MIKRRSGITQDPLHTVTQSYPALFLECKLLSARGGDGIEPGLPMCLREPPLRAQPTGLRHPVECRIERPLFDAPQVRSPALDVRGDGVAVHAPLRGYGLEDKKGKRTLEDIVLVFRHDTYLAMPRDQVKNQVQSLS